MNKNILAALAVVFGLASVATAQTAPTVMYRARIYNTTITGLATTYDFPASQVVCGQVRVNPPAGVVANPVQFRWEDPANASLDCVWTDAGTGPLFALPVGTANYEATLQGISEAGLVSNESARSNPFWRPGSPPATPTQFRLVRP